LHLKHLPAAFSSAIVGYGLFSFSSTTSLPLIQGLAVLEKDLMVYSFSDKDLGSPTFWHTNRPEIVK
jgi:hypothetical protein